MSTDDPQSMSDDKKTALGPGAVCCEKTEDCALPCQSAAMAPFPSAEELEPTEAELDEIDGDKELLFDSLHTDFTEEDEK